MNQQIYKSVLHKTRVEDPMVFECYIFDMGYGYRLLKRISKEDQEELAFFGVDVNQSDKEALLREILLHKPCIFDEMKI